MEFKQRFIVISKADKTTLGPFDSREQAVAWAKGKTWMDGYVVRFLHPVSL